MKRIILALTAGVLLTATFAMADDAVKPRNKVDTRAADQQKRIGQGVQSGALTPKETVKLEKKEVAIHKEVHADRKANGGTLTPAEKKTVNHQQNQVSKQIYDKKHN